MRICTVSWSQVCRPWDAGGLDLKPTRAINDSLLLHLCWQLFTQNSECSSLLQKRFLSYGTPKSRYFKSSIWLGVKDKLSLVSSNTRWIIGNGENILLWFDNWMDSSLVSMLGLPSHLFPSLKANLAFVINDGKWNIPRTILDFPLVAAQIMQITLSVTPLSDKRVWIHSPDGQLSAKLAYQFLNPVPLQLD